MTEALSLLIIGYGNSLRRDDGAGLLLAERLASCWRDAGIDVQIILTHQLMPELAEEIAAPSISHIVFVDARVAENNESDVGIEPIPPSGETGQSLGHQMNPAMLLTYAERLFGHAPAAYVITIPGVDFGFGEELSESVLQYLDESNAIAQSAMAAFWR